MARLLIGSSLRDIVERYPWLHHVLWGAEAAVFGTFLLLAWLMPLRAAQSMGHALMSRLGPRQPKHRRVLRNLEIAFPEKSQAEREQMAGALWGNVGKVFAEYGQLPRISRNLSRHVEIAGAEHVAAYIRGERAGIFLTAHLGNWEISGLVFKSLGIPVTTVYTPLSNPYLDRMIARSRRGGHGANLLARDTSTRGLVRELDQGHSIGLVMDQRVDSGAPVPFFGVDKMTTLIPARLALRYGVDLMMVRIERLGAGRFRLTFLPPIPSPDSGTDTEKAMALMRHVNASFEDWIRARPQDWFITQRVWPKGCGATGRGKSCCAGVLSGIITCYL